MVPLVAVTMTIPAGLTSFAAGFGVMVRAAGADVGAAAGGAGAGVRGAAVTWQRSRQRRSEPLTTTPPTTASTAKAAASQVLRARRVDVNKTPVFSSASNGRRGPIVSGSRAAVASPPTAYPVRNHPVSERLPSLLRKRRPAGCQPVTIGYCRTRNRWQLHSVWSADQGCEESGNRAGDPMTALGPSNQTVDRRHWVSPHEMGVT